MCTQRSLAVAQDLNTIRCFCSLCIFALGGIPARIYKCIFSALPRLSGERLSFKHPPAGQSMWILNEPRTSGRNLSGSGWCFQRVSSCTHIFQTAHEVVADWGAGQVGCVQASPDVEEIIRAQHGVILLSVAGGGEDPINQDGYLKRPQEGQERGGEWGNAHIQRAGDGLIISRFLSWFHLSSS